jgi:hypothetical protein
MNAKLSTLVAALAVWAALTGVAVAGTTRPKPISLRPEQSVGPAALGERRADVEARLGKGTANGDWVSSYHYRRATLLVSYSTHNRVREVVASGGRLFAYGQRLADEHTAIAVLKSHGWKIDKCNEYKFARHASDGRYSSVSWRQHELQGGGVSALGPLGFCPIGSPH